MRPRIALIGLVALALPLTPATVEAKSPGPRTLVVKVTGLPKGTKALLRVKGPGKVRKATTRTSKTWRRLKPGTYRVRTAGVTGFDYTVRPKKAHITRKRGARVRVTFTATRPADSPETPTVIPPTPWPTMGSVRSIALVSSSVSGTPADRLSVHPAWSPDGTRVAFGSCAGNLVAVPRAGCYIFVKTLETGQVLRLNKADLNDEWAMTNGWSAELAWAPAAQIAFTTSRIDPDGNKDVYVVKPDDSAVTRAYPTPLSGTTVPRADRPLWSPDGRQLLFQTSDRGFAPGTGDLLTTDLAGHFFRMGSDGWTHAASWVDDATVLFAAQTGEAFGLYRQTRGGPVQLVRGGLDTAYVAAAPGGTRAAIVTWDPLVATDTNEGADIYVLPLAGGAAQRVTVDSTGQQTQWEPADPVWSPDGSRIAFTAGASQRGWMLLVKDLTTGAITAVTPGQYEFVCEEWEPSEDGGPPECVRDVSRTSVVSSVAWSPDGTRLAFVANHNGLVPGDGLWTQDVFVATL